jgi:hypothetical protein
MLNPTLSSESAPAEKGKKLSVKDTGMLAEIFKFLLN